MIAWRKYRNLGLTLALISVILTTCAAAVFSANLRQVSGSTTSEVQQYDYIIYTDGATTYAKNGTTGAIDYSSVDAATAIQEAVNSLPTKTTYGNHYIFIQPGPNNDTYSIAETINVTGSVMFVGTGIDDVLELQNGTNKPMFSFTNGGISDGHNAGLENLRLEGDKNNQSGGDYLVTISNDYDAIIEHVWFWQAYGGDLHLQNTVQAQVYRSWFEDSGGNGKVVLGGSAGTQSPPALYVDQGTSPKIIDNIFFDNPHKDIYTYLVTTDPQIRGNIFVDSLTGALVLDASKYGQVSENWFEENSFNNDGLYPAILVDSTSPGNRCSNIEISKNTGFAEAPTRPSYFVDSDGNCDQIDIVANDFSGATVGLYRQATGSTAFSVSENRGNTNQGLLDCSYQVSITGASYSARNGRTGVNDFVDSNATRVINNALAAGPGTVCLDPGTFKLSGEVQMNSKGEGLVGQGQEVTILNQTRSGYSALHINGANYERVSDLSLYVPQAGATDHVLKITPLTSSGTTGSVFQNLRIQNGDAAHYGIFGQNVDQSKFDNIEISKGVNGVDLVGNDASTAHGHNTWSGIKILTSGASAGTGFKIDKVGSFAERYNSISNLEVKPALYTIGSTGVSIAGDYNIVNTADIENVDTGINVVSGNNVGVVGAEVMANGESLTSKGAVYVQSAARNFYLSDADILPVAPTSGNTGIRDQVTQPQGGSVYTDVRVGNFSSGSRILFSAVSVTKALGLVDVQTGRYSENGGTATFSGTGSRTAFSINHNLVFTPTNYQVVPCSPAAAITFYVTASSTQLTVTFTTAPAVGTNNVALCWRASWTDN